MAVKKGGGSHHFRKKGRSERTLRGIGGTYCHLIAPGSKRVDGVGG